MLCDLGGVRFFLLTVGLLVAPSCASREAGAPAPEAAKPAYVQRGDSVAAQARTYTEELERFHDRLQLALEKDAPELAKKLVRPKPLTYGYQILPELKSKTTNKAKKSRPKKATVTRYSWPRTEQLIVRESSKLEISRGQLDEAIELGEPERYKAYERVVSGFKKLEDNRKKIEQHVQYNRFWQKTFAEDRARYERVRAIFDAVVERKRLHDDLERQELSSDRKAELEKRVEELSSEISGVQPGCWPPSFLRVTAAGDGSQVLRLRVYTDIIDPKFLDQVKQAVEERWQVEHRGVRYRVEVILERRVPEEIYEPDAPPERGEQIDVKKHVKRFPVDGAVLTTGAKRTHAVVGRYVALGPGEISRNTLAHEFGHLLGFEDRYVRACRDIGEDGYELVETIPDPTDIMCAPGLGTVNPRHFESLLEAVR